MVLGQPGELQIMNVGNGPAVNVNIKSFVPQELDDKFEFEQVSLLRPGDCRRVNFKINGSIRQSNLKSHEQLFGEAVAKTLKLGEFRIIDIAEFYDIEGSFYKQLLPETESGVRPGFVKLIEEGKGATLIAQEK